MGRQHGYVSKCSTHTGVLNHVYTVHGVTAEICAVAPRSHGILYVAFTDNTVRAFDLPAAQEICVVDAADVRALVGIASDDESWLAVGCNAGCVNGVVLVL